MATARALLLRLLAAAAAATAAAAAAAAAPAPRLVRIANGAWVNRDGAPVVLAGPNVVVKGPPYLPTVAADAPACADVVNAACTAAGTCSSCTTFGPADVANFKARGWNALRLGVVWAGAQPADADALDPGFLARLDAFLNLTDAAGLAVVLDNHGDMTGSLNCGNGAPAWVQKAADPAGTMIGRPLTTGLPYSLVPGLDVTQLGGYGVCGDNATAWAQHAGDPLYNLLSPCCAGMNSDNPGALGFTTLAQATMAYITAPGPGRDAFVRYWRLLAQAAASHPSAVAAELMNEPMTLARGDLFDTWREAGTAISAVVPDMSVSVSDTGEAVLLPPWAVPPAGDILISNATLAWMRESPNVFLAWHWYGLPANASDAVAAALALGAQWGVPTLLTEFMDCAAWDAASAAGVGHLFWHYSAYCTTGPAFGSRAVPADTFGACILGWAGGNSAYNCSAGRGDRGASGAGGRGLWSCGHRA